MNTLEQNNVRNFDAASSTKTENTLSKAQRIMSTLVANYTGSVAIQLWDGKILTTNQNIQCVLRINHPGVIRSLILHRDLIKLAEAYITGEIEVSGDFEAIFELGDYVVEGLNLNYRLKAQLLMDALTLPSLSNKHDQTPLKAGDKQQRNSRQAISHHYDIGNNFYQLWLDKKMVYSCAYFSDAEQSLDNAQEDKLDYLCKKLRLQPGQKLLDIGCGWGALAIWAAKHYGVNVDGITLSKEQQKLAVKRVKEAGLENQISIQLKDYRDLENAKKYDRIISVGMFEHIGVKNFPTYFTKVKRLLKPEGLFLNHGITNKDGWRKTPITRFMNQYIFPDGELARISVVNDAMENAGFEVLDVESLRRHYAMTLRHWILSLEAYKDDAIRLSSEATYHLWRLYMAGCAYYFDEGSINIYQVLVGHQLEKIPTPLRREDLYTLGSTNDNNPIIRRN